MNEPIDSTETEPPQASEGVISAKDADGKANASELDDASLKQVSEAGTIASNHSDEQSTNQSRAPVESFFGLSTVITREGIQDKIKDLTEEQKQARKQRQEALLRSIRTEDNASAHYEAEDNHQELLARMDRLEHLIRSSFNRRRATDRRTGTQSSNTGRVRRELTDNHQNAERRRRDEGRVKRRSDYNILQRLIANLQLDIQDKEDYIEELERKLDEKEERLRAVEKASIEMKEWIKEKFSI